MPCEMCGRKTDLVLAEVENVELNVCSGCAWHGTIKKRAAAPSALFSAGSASSATSSRPSFIPKEKPEFKIVDNFSSLLRSAREKKGMKQEDFAKLLNERESIVAKWEAGSLKPGIDAAYKVGRRLGINLVEEDLEVAAKVEAGKKGDELTLGDFVKVRKRR